MVELCVLSCIWLVVTLWMIHRTTPSDRPSESLRRLEVARKEVASRCVRWPESVSAEPETTEARESEFPPVAEQRLDRPKKRTPAAAKKVQHLRKRDLRQAGLVVG